jgi:Mrp family chromosome partitioning ATPase/capsular polysaccharide biosynthesis protein
MDGDQSQRKDALELRDYLRVIKERFWVIPVIIVIAVGAALAVALTSIPQYRTYTSLLYEGNKPLQQAVAGVPAVSGGDDDQQLRTAAVLVRLEPIAAAVAEELGTSRSVSSLLDMVSVEPRESENVLDIYAVGPYPEECAAVANEFAAQFLLARQAADKATVKAARDVVEDKLRTLSRDELASDYGQGLQQQLNNLRILEELQTGGFSVVQPATVPGHPFAPRPVRDGVLAFVLGLVVGVGAAFLLDYLDRRVKDEKALEEELGAPVLAKVPLVGGGGRGRRNGEGLREAVGFDKRPALLEAFRTLRSNLEFFSLDRRESIWLITSGAPQEGKTTTTVNLALGLALSGKRVVVLEADLRRPMVHDYFGVEQTPGLSNVLAGTKRLEDALRFIEADEFMPPESRRRPGEKSSGLIQRNMYAVASGPIPPNPAELLSSPRMGQVVKDLAGMSDCLLIDTPPVLVVSDAVTIARHADGVIVVLRLGSTTRDQLREVRDVFHRAGIRVIGAVAVAARRSPAYRRRKGYGYGYEPAPSDLLPGD